jgi:hypothetical protein
MCHTLDIQGIIKQFHCKRPILLASMKKDVVDFIARCMECQKVKVEHRHPTWDCYNHFPFLNGNGKLLLLISLPSFPKQQGNMIPSW